MSRFRLQNRYQDGSWQDLGEEFEHKRDAIPRALLLSADSICYGMVRVIDRDNCVVQTFGAGEGEWYKRLLGDPPVAPAPVSPNGYHPGTAQYQAEQWMKSQGYGVPCENRHPYLFKAMLEQYLETPEYREWSGS